MAKHIQTLDAWGLQADRNGQITMKGFPLSDLARDFGTPLHVVHEERLEETARSFVSVVGRSYPGIVSVHYPFKCNGVPVIVEAMKRSGLRAEVMTEFELELALHLGYEGEEIIVNGPCKTERFLRRCLEDKVRFIIVDSLDELHELDRLTRETSSEASILLRINPDYVPRGMNHGSATGSRKGCAFGLDLKGEEVGPALHFLSAHRFLRFFGFHFHIGTGIRDPRDYSNALKCLPRLIRLAREAKVKIRIVDVGGGFASMTTKELTTREMLVYQGLGRLPESPEAHKAPGFADFASAISDAVVKHFGAREAPELIYEPGRCIVSPNQLLLLTVHRIKERDGVGKWLITDGGLGTVTLPTYYEYHEVFLCNDVLRPRTEKVHIIGPACFAGDIVYRNKWMPKVRTGEVLAIMDTGAYFVALESSFGFARPAIVGVNHDGVRLLRRRETYEDLIMRDNINQKEFERRIS